MRSVRTIAAGLAASLAVAGVALVAAPPAAFGDGATSVPVTCSGIPLVGSTSATANINAADSVDPVTVGGTVTNTINVPVPVANVPVSATISEVDLFEPVPANVTVTAVNFTSSSFSGHSWSVSGGVLKAVLTGSVAIGGSAPTPTVPDVSVVTTVGGSPRTIAWKVPTKITATASWALGTINAVCTPDDLTTTLISTTVVAANTAPTATAQSVSTAYQTATAITLAGTDAESDPLTFAVGTGPSHGTLTGTAPNLTYTPAAGYSGPDSFTFTASDGSLVSLPATVSITVAAPGATVPGAPVIGAVTAKEGQATVEWAAPSSNGGSPVTGYVVTPFVGGVAGTAVPVAGGGTTSATLTGLANGVAETFRVAAVNAVGTGPQSAASAAATPQWWLPWSSGPAAVTQLYTWFTGAAPSAADKASWLAQLDAGTKLPGDLVAALRVGPDATGNVDPTTRLYAAYFVRIPDASGLAHWIKKKRGGMKITAISAEFAKSHEFTARYGSLTNQAFVKQIYLNVQGRPGEASGVAFWTKKLDTKAMTRGQVMVGFSESHEYKTAQVADVHAAVVAIDLDGTAPTVASRDAFVTALTGSSLADVVRTLIHQDTTFAGRAG